MTRRFLTLFGFSLALFGASFLAAPARASRPAAADGNPPLRSTYLALGDSFSYGYLIPEKPADPTCASQTAPGFVCVFYRYLKAIKSNVRLDNLSEPGADSCELAGTGHRCYDTTPRANPMNAAAAFLQAHPGKVSPITVTIGGNDLLAQLPQWITNPGGTEAMVPAILRRYRTNLDTILSRLRTAAPTAEIILTTQPNPLIGLGSPPLPPGLPALGKGALTSLNDIMKQEAPKYGAVIADAYAAWSSYSGDKLKLDWAPTYLLQGRAEIHPTPLGYRVYGKAVIKASGYLATLRLKSHLSATQVGAGGSEQIKGKTNPSVALTLTSHDPTGSVSKVKGQASVSGTFSFALDAGTQPGTYTARVCAHDNAGRTACGATLSFSVT
ncbi:MAG TPA: GDSL-type esterase/lipase family protein [Chloroflexota bacterium]